jgi:hypothetical protein
MLVFIIFGLLEATQVKKNIGIHCSNDFYFENRMNKICKWLFDNGTSFKDTYQSAKQDCPYDHVLATFNSQTNNHKLSLSSCQGTIEIWINQDSMANNNVLKINNGGQAQMSSKSSSELLEYFLCIDKSQTITCESDEYLDEDTLLCMDTVEYNQACSKNEMCNQASNLYCNLTMNKCYCSSLMYWNGSTCSYCQMSEYWNTSLARCGERFIFFLWLYS